MEIPIRQQKEKNSISIYINSNKFNEVVNKRIKIIKKIWRC